MSNNNITDRMRTAILSRVFRSATIMACGLLLAGCSSVFTSSIAGRIIDKEEADDNNTVGVANASVWLYLEQEDWEADYQDWIASAEATLPDDGSRAVYRYFQSTVTNGDGNYQFNGFVWQTTDPAYGKTADRRRIFLLVYHPDYGLWKNPVPLFIVSDVTTQLDMIAITDLWNEARITGRATDWSQAENKKTAEQGLGEVTVRIYVAETWSYDSAGAIADAVYPRTPTQTLTSDAEGYYSGTIRFPMQPDRATHATYNNAPVRISWVRDDYRANDPSDGTGLANAGLVTNVDLNNNGRTADSGEWEDAHLQTVLLMETADNPVQTLADIQLQRWRFTASVRGRVFSMVDDDNDANTPAAKQYQNGVEVTLGIPADDTDPDTTWTDSQTAGDTTSDGHYNFGTVEWELADILNADDAAAQLAARRKGEISFSLLAGTNPPSTPSTGKLKPGDSINLELEKKETP